MNEKETTLLVIGATGGTGKELVKQGLARGYRVRALVRNPAKFKIVHPRLEVCQGNVLDPESLFTAMQGVGAVLSALGHKNFFFPGRILSDGSRNMILAMERRGIDRVLAVTAMGISENRFRLGLYYSLFLEPFLLWFYFRDKERQEDVFRQSRLNYTIIRPGQFIPGKSRATYRHGENLGSYILTRLVSRATVATFMLDELEQHRYLRKAVCITH